MATVCLMSKCEHNGRIQATGNGINVFWPSWKKLSVKTFCVVLRVKGRRGEREAARWNPADWLQNICARMPNEKKNFSSARQLTSDCCCAGRRPGCQWKTAVHAQQAFPRQITTLQEKFPGRVCQCLSRKKKKNPTTSPFRLLNWPSLSVWIRDHNEMLTIIVSSTPSSPTHNFNELRCEWLSHFRHEDEYKDAVFPNIHFICFMLQRDDKGETASPVNLRRESESLISARWCSKFKHIMLLRKDQSELLRKQCNIIGVFKCHGEQVVITE